MTTQASTEMTVTATDRQSSNDRAQGQEVRCRNVYKAFGRHESPALDGIDITVAAGSITVLLGPSGCGKTTLLRCINRLVEPTSGRIFLDGQEITAANDAELRRIRRRIGMIFQQFNLVRRERVLTNVLTGALGTAGQAASLVGRWPKDEIERALNYKRQPQVAVMEERAELKRDLVDHVSRQRRPDQEHLSDAKSSREADLDEVKAECGGHVQIRIDVVDIVKSPEKRNLVISSVPKIKTQIQQQKGCQKPDSSRFWDTRDYRPGMAPPSFDKQYVRDWLIESGWDKEPPAPELPADVVERTTDKYLEAYRLIAGRELAG